MIMNATTIPGSAIGNDTTEMSARLKGSAHEIESRDVFEQLSERGLRDGRSRVVLGVVVASDGLPPHSSAGTHFLRLQGAIFGERL